MRTAVVFLFAVALAVAAPVPKAVKQKSDAERLEGRWVSVSIDCGKGAEADESYWLSVNDGKLLWSHLSSPIRSDTPPDSPFTLDQSASPKEIDELRGGRENPSRHTYIYDLDGDNLKWCFSPFNTPRPTELKGDRQTGVSCLVFKRVKEDK